MREQIEARRAALQAEHERGVQMAARMDKDREALAQTLLRISGAVQVLDELLAGAEETGPRVEGANDGDNC